MKHPSWCDEDGCEEGFHMFSASYSNDGLARIEVRLSQDIKSNKLELELGDSNGSFNPIIEGDQLSTHIGWLKEFRDDLSKIIQAVESK